MDRRPNLCFQWQPVKNWDKNILGQFWCETVLNTRRTFDRIPAAPREEGENCKSSQRNKIYAFLHLSDNPLKTGLKRDLRSIGEQKLNVRYIWVSAWSVSICFGARGPFIFDFQLFRGPLTPRTAAAALLHWWEFISCGHYQRSRLGRWIQAEETYLTLFRSNIEFLPAYLVLSSSSIALIEVKIFSIWC